MLLDAALSFSRRMVAARLKKVPTVDKRKEFIDSKMIQQTGSIMLIKSTIVKINQHGENK